MPLPPPRPVATPGRRLQSSSNGNFVNELSITGSNAVVSWNSHTPGLTPFNCTGVGDGVLTCSGTLVATDFQFADGTSILEFIGIPKPSLPPPTPPTTPPYCQTTSIADMVGCVDGSTCYITLRGWNCCGVGNRAMCPPDHAACNDLAGNGVDFSCWADCTAHGGTLCSI